MRRIICSFLSNQAVRAKNFASRNILAWDKCRAAHHGSVGQDLIHQRPFAPQHPRQVDFPELLTSPNDSVTSQALHNPPVARHLAHLQVTWSCAAVMSAAS